MSVGGTDLAVSLVSVHRADKRLVASNCPSPKSRSASGPQIGSRDPAQWPDGYAPRERINSRLGARGVGSGGTKRAVWQPDRGEAQYKLFADDTHVVSDVNTNNNVVTFSAFLWVDSDGDGIPDSWMLEYLVIQRVWPVTTLSRRTVTRVTGLATCKNI